MTKDQILKLAEALRWDKEEMEFEANKLYTFLKVGGREEEVSREIAKAYLGGMSVYQTRIDKALAQMEPVEETIPKEESKLARAVESEDVGFV